MSENHRSIQVAIKKYAHGYRCLNELQVEQDEKIIPIGDQKTGVIGEYYAKIYLEDIYKPSKVEFGGTSQKGWDLRIAASSTMEKKYQIKTVSAFSTTRRISPIHPGWDYLLLVYLDKNMFPKRMWEISYNESFGDKVIKNRTMPDPDKHNSGSAIFIDKKDVTCAFTNALGKLSEPSIREDDVVNWFADALAEVGEDYFTIRAAYTPELVRERLFCYELYHQLRKISDGIGVQGLYLHGEIDKRGHSLFDRSDWRNPDFVLHMPGSMEKNWAIVEVKGNIEDRLAIQKDIETITTFVEEYGYKLGLYVIYGHSPDEATDAIMHAIDANKREFADGLSAYSNESPLINLNRSVLNRIRIIVAKNSADVRVIRITELL